MLQEANYGSNWTQSTWSRFRARLCCERSISPFTSMLIYHVVYRILGCHICSYFWSSGIAGYTAASFYHQLEGTNWAKYRGKEEQDASLVEEKRMLE
ncbi:uncharacterized protein [Rutidosis leptorrhynchoides]|uniref:uncharacterized protein isoform X2 n=1 Tax=Rutidosis leptorrhynchoides TaxID=125765 RepID=UPI003A9A404C